MKEKSSDLIKKQYTEYPYPPIPIGGLEEEVLYSTNYEFVNYLCTGTFKSHKQTKILDVGCGTGFSTLKLAQQNPEAFITAIDISAVSIEIAKKRLKNAGINLNRINFIEADLMKITDIGERFDYIVCTGVLHHMESPEIGLNFIKLHLKEDGLIYLMLYSEYGRFYQSLMRKTINLFQTNKTDIAEGVNIGKEVLKILPDQHPILSRYRRSYEASLNVINKEFADSDSQFVDAYINAKERTYNIDELFDFIEGNGLVFLRFQDEPTWDLNYLLNGNDYLISKTLNFSMKEKYKIGEIIESEKNFAFFVSKKDFKKVEINDNDLLKYRVKLSILNKTQTDNQTIEIISPLGLSVKINIEIYSMYEAIDENKSIKENLELIYKETENVNILKVEEFLLFLRTMEKNGALLFIK